MDLNFDVSGNYRTAVVVICVALLVGAYLLTRLQPFGGVITKRSSAS
jgi:hypothetical protein